MNHLLRGNERLWSEQKQQRHKPFIFCIVGTMKNATAPTCTWMRNYASSIMRSLLAN